MKSKAGRQHTNLLVELFGLLLLLNLINPGNVNADDSETFSETGQTVSGDFLHYWRDNGGQPVFGWPITGILFETSKDSGQQIATQWFERNRFELWPKAGGGNEVRLGLLGRELRQEALGENPKNTIDDDFKPAQPLVDPAFNDSQKFFEETQHNLRYRFLDYWLKNGGQMRFGLPLSEEHMEYEPETGQYYLTQWFERARMEYHPENQPPNDILLGLLGNELKKPTVDRQKRFDFQWKLGRASSFLTQPSASYVDSNGNIYVNDRGTGRINKYNSAFKLINYWYVQNGSQAIAGPPPNRTNDPASPFLYSIANQQSNKIHRLLKTGLWDELTFSPSGDADSDTPNLAMAVDEMGNIFILKYSAYVTNLVWEYDSKGQFINKFVPRSQLTNPTALAVYRSHIYIADGLSGKYYIFDQAQNIANPGEGIKIPVDNPNQSANLVAIGVDSKGNVLTGEYGTISRFGSDNKFITNFTTAGRAVGQIFNPVSLSLDSKDNVYVSDPANHRVELFDPVGNPTGMIGDVPTPQDVYLTSAQAVATSAGTNSMIVVADPASKSISEFEANGRFIAKWPAGRISALAVGLQGQIFSLNSSAGVITIYDRTGKMLQQWGGIGKENGKFRLPSGLAVDKDGFVYVADTGNNRIQKFEPTKGAFVLAWSCQIDGDGKIGLNDTYTGPTGLAIEPSSDNIYVVEPELKRLLKFNPQGKLLGVINAASLKLNETFEPVAVATPPALLGANSTNLTNNGVFINTRRGIYKLDAQDKPVISELVKVITPGTDGGDGNLHNLTGLAVDGDGNIFATDVYARLQKFRLK